MKITSLPKKFVLFGKQFIFDNVFSWYGTFTEHNLLVNIIELDSDNLFDSESGEKVFYCCTIYHFDEMVSQSIGTSPLLAAVEAKLPHYLDSVTVMNDFLIALKEA